MSRSSSRSQRSSPGSPFWACRGAWCVEVAKCLLPRPPRPPRATSGLLARGDEIGDELAASRRRDGRAGRHVEHQVVAGLAVPPRAARRARRAWPGSGAGAEVAKRRLARVHAQVDRAAAAAVAAIRAAAGNVGLAPERRRAVAAGAGANPDLYPVEEHRVPSSHGPPPPPARLGRRARSCGAGSEVPERVDPVAAAPDRTDPDLEVEVRAGSVAGLPDPADLLAPA